MAKKNSKKRGGWLFKEEPSCYSYFQLERDGSTQWTGVKNPLARIHLRSIQEGDRVLYYHTGSVRAIVGEMRVLAGATETADAKDVQVAVTPVKRWDPPVSLAEIKKDGFFADWELVRITRLSVMPVSPEQWERLETIRDRSAIGTKTA